VNILGISGTPKKGGFTDRLLESALSGARSAGGITEKVVLNDLAFKPCQECGGCDETGICVLDDDMRKLYAKLAQADAIIVASPIFFGTLSAQLKMMVDRLQSVWVAKYILKKEPSGPRRRKGLFLCAGGKETQDYFENAKKIVRILFATLDTDYGGELFFSGLNEKSKDAKAVEEMLNKAFILGASLDE